jgi:protein dithiol:quinone oxidoreductase
LLSGLFGGSLARSGLWVSALLSAAGAAVAGRHVYVLYNPSVSCGLDPVEDFVNSLPPAQWLPQAFFADGTCGAKLPPVLGLDIPEWSLLWLVVLTLTAVLLSLRRA